MTDSAEPTVPVPVPRPRSRRGRRPRAATIVLRDLIVVIVIAVAASFLIRTFLVRSFYIPSTSMQNTLQPNDRVLVDELVPTLIPVHRGDVVVFTDPGGWLTTAAPAAAAPVTALSASAAWALSLIGLSPTDADDHLIKRVMGLPGDRVSCCTADGRMTINGTPITEPYLKDAAADDTASEEEFNVVVPPGKLWVMGDNRNGSKDSRLQRATPGHGFVPESDLVGRAFVISWPVMRWAVLSDFPNIFAQVPNPTR